MGDNDEKKRQVTIFVTLTGGLTDDAYILVLMDILNILRTNHARLDLSNYTETWNQLVISFTAEAAFRADHIVTSIKGLVNVASVTESPHSLQIAAAA